MESPDVMKALAAALLPHLQSKHDAGGAGVAPYLHGPGGLFGVSGLDRDVFSTRIQPIGLASMLPAIGSRYTNPLFAYITGFLAGSTVEAETPCGEPPYAGSMKVCYQTAEFGLKQARTREIELNKLGQLIDRGEFTDLRLVNDPLVTELSGIFPGLPPQGQILAGREVLARWLELGVTMQNWLADTLWNGNPANNNAGGGYREPPGLGILVGTVKVDALSNVACPSLYSDVKNFNYGNISTATNPDIVRLMAEVMRMLRHNASRMNMGATEWVIVMREGLFYELTAIWPCVYLTDRCTLNDTAKIDPVPMVNVESGIRMRDEMRNGKYLLIDGVRVPVVIDDALTELTSGDSNRVPIGCYASDIYILPLTVRGGLPVLYWEYFDYMAGVMPGVGDGRLGNFFWTDAGRYMWTFRQTAWCVYWQTKIEPRIVLKTPHLAGRINNVVYCPIQHERTPFPTDPYFVNGGATSRPAPSYYVEWRGRQ